MGAAGANPQGDFTPEQLEIIQRWLNRNDEPWIAAARKAMNGDWTDLQERVDLLAPERRE